MIRDSVRDAINAQMIREFYSSYLYLAMAAYFESMNLKGFAAWMGVQAREEMAHGLKFYGYLVEQGARVSFAAIEAPRGEWGTPLEAFGHALAHEQKVTGHIHDLMELAMEEKDFATAGFLGWFVKEQVEEEANATAIVARLQLASAGGPSLLYMMDHELGKRGKAA